MQQEIYSLASELGRRLIDKNWQIAIAESCTGGGICYALTEVPGSSAWLDRGFVTYSNQAKQDMLGVSVQTLERYGAVSEEVVGEMVAGALINSVADIAIAVTGIAGPGGGSAEKPVGTVYIAWQVQKQALIWQKFSFSGSRELIRLKTISEALIGCLNKMAWNSG